MAKYAPFPPIRCWLKHGHRKGEGSGIKHGGVPDPLDPHHAGPPGGTVYTAQRQEILKFIISHKKPVLCILSIQI